MQSAFKIVRRSLLPARDVVSRLVSGLLVVSGRLNRKLIESTISRASPSCSNSSIRWSFSLYSLWINLCKFAVIKKLDFSAETWAATNAEQLNNLTGVAVVRLIDCTSNLVDWLHDCSAAPTLRQFHTEGFRQCSLAGSKLVLLYLSHLGFSSRESWLNVAQPEQLKYLRFGLGWTDNCIIIMYTIACSSSKNWEFPLLAVLLSASLLPALLWESWSTMQN